MARSVTISAEDRSKLLLSNGLKNTDFSETIMSIIEKYQFLESDDVEVLTSREKSRDLFKSDYAILLKVNTNSELQSQVKDRTGRNRFYTKVYTINGESYVMTSQLYGKSIDSTHRNNRTPFLDWIMNKLGVSQQNQKKAWLLTWNPNTSSVSFENYDERRNDLINGSEVVESWACLNSHVSIGDRVYIMRLGTGIRNGIVASGYAASESYFAPHYNPEKRDNGEQIRKIDVNFDYMLDRDSSIYLSQTALMTKFSSQQWSPQGSGITIKSEYVSELEKEWLSLCETDNDWWPPLNDYTPGFSVEDWIKLLEDNTIFKDNCLAIMKRMKDIGGSASCTQLAEKYGESMNFYNSGSSSLAENIAKKTGCNTDWKDKNNARWWPILYQGRYARRNEVGGYIYRLRDELSEALDRIDLSRIPLYARDKEDVSMTDKQKVDRIKKYIAWKGFSYTDGLVENFYLSLKSKPFVILAGTSGTGKTRLVKLFAEAISAEYKMVPVRPDWSDSSDLFGHVNLNGEFVPGAILEFISDAVKSPEKPFILCLDEMNLARVEYYLSDFLSVIETREMIDGVIESAPLMSLEKYGSDSVARDKYGELGFPQNLYVVGTVNMDETTFPFSKKVLDRANTIEFSYVDLIPDNTVVEAESPLDLNNDFLVSEYLFLSQCQDSLVNDVCASLQRINEVLKTANAHVGYRVRDEIVFYMLNNKKAGLLSDNAALDNEIMQKILPRIQGSSSSVKDMLCELFKIFAGDYDGYQTQSDDTASKMMKKLQAGSAIYPQSAEKVAFMVRRFEEDGFTSYWL